jgi:hypothetical protein
VVLALCCLGGAGGDFWIYRTYTDNAGPARDATAGYLDAVLAGDYPRAYGQLRNRVRSATTQEAYTRIQSAQLKITGYKIDGVYER